MPPIFPAFTPPAGEMTLSLMIRIQRLQWSLLALLPLGVLAIFALTACGKGSDSDGVSVVQEAEDGEGESEVDEAARLALEKIANLGYVEGTAPAVGATGVTVHDREAAWPGYNYYVGILSPGATLMDMEGKVLHRWSFEATKAFPGTGFSTGDSEERRRRREAHGIKTTDESLLQRAWRRARLLPHGELIAIFEGIGMIKIDRDSNLVWAVENHSHHDLDLDESGRIHVICREAENEPRFGDANPVLLDYVRVYSPDAKLIDSISIDQAYKDSEFPVTDNPVRSMGDIYHTNSIQILDGRFADRLPALKKGNLLLSFRNTDEIGVLDPSARKMVWVARGPWKAQHEPSLIEDGRILLFDNKGGRDDYRYSRILEFDPLSLEITWSYEGTPDNQLKSAAGSSVMKLPNGNIMITEMEQGRVLEVSREKLIVWEFINPEKTAEDAGRRSGIFDCVRIDPSFVADWLDADSTGTLESASPA